MLPIFFGLFVVWFFYVNTSAEHQQQILKNFKEANYRWVILALVLGFLGNVSRAIRWNYLLHPLGYQPKVINNFMAIMAGYLSNFGIPRSGEILRASLLTTYEKVPFSKVFGTIVAERVIDFFMLLLVIIIALIFQAPVILNFLKEQGLGLSFFMFLLFLSIVGGTIFFKILKTSNHSLAIRIKSFLSGLYQGITSIFRMKNKGFFIIHTFFIWGVYITVFWITTYSFEALNNLSFGAIITSFLAGSFAVSATNGGVGVFPVAVSKTLLLYGVPLATGDAFGWVLWSTQTLMYVFFGILSFIFLPIFNKTR